MRPANSREPAGRRLQGRFGSFTRAGWHRLENRHLWPIP